MFASSPDGSRYLLTYLNQLVSHCGKAKIAARVVAMYPRGHFSDRVFGIRETVHLVRGNLANGGWKPPSLGYRVVPWPSWTHWDSAHGHTLAQFCELQ